MRSSLTSDTVRELAFLYTKLADFMFKVHFFVIPFNMSLIILIMSDLSAILVIHIIKVPVEQVELVVLIYLRLILDPSVLFWPSLIVYNNHSFIHVLIKVGSVRDYISHDCRHLSGLHQVIDRLVVLGWLWSKSVSPDCKVIALIFGVALTVS